MSIEVHELNNTNCKTYLVVSAGEAILIDPVREHIARYRKEIEERGIALRAVVETHTHADHLMIGRTEKQALAAPIVQSVKSPSPIVDRRIDEGDVIELGSVTLRVLATPGHTPDSLSLVGPGVVFTGDALFIGGSGRTDFPGGDPGEGYDSIVNKLFTLPDDTVVWPGHDYRGNTSSTIGREKTTNPRLAGKTRDEYVEIMNNLGLPFPDRIQQVLQVNQSGFEQDEVGGFPMVLDVAKVPSVAPAELAAKLASDHPPVILDVREPEEFVGELGHIEGALHVPMDALRARMPKLAAGYVDREIAVVCRAGSRSGTVAAILIAAGFANTCNLERGMLAWHEAGLPVQR